MPAAGPLGSHAVAVTASHRRARGAGCFSSSLLDFRRKVSVACFPEGTLYLGLTVWSNLKKPLCLVTIAVLVTKISFKIFSNCFPKAFYKVLFEVCLVEIKCALRTLFSSKTWFFSSRVHILYYFKIRDDLPKKQLETTLEIIPRGGSALFPPGKMRSFPTFPAHLYAYVYTHTLYVYSATCSLHMYVCLGERF